MQIQVNNFWSIETDVLSAERLATLSLHFVRAARKLHAEALRRAGFLGASARDELTSELDDFRAEVAHGNVKET